MKRATLKPFMKGTLRWLCGGFLDISDTSLYPIISDLIAAHPYHLSSSYVFLFTFILRSFLRSFFLFIPCSLSDRRFLFAAPMPCMASMIMPAEAQPEPTQTAQPKAKVEHEIYEGQITKLLRQGWCNPFGSGQFLQVDMGHSNMFYIRCSTGTDTDGRLPSPVSHLPNVRQASQNRGRAILRKRNSC